MDCRGWLIATEPVSSPIDKSGANKAAINSVIADTDAGVLPRQSKYLNNRVEQDYRAVKRITRPMLGFKAFRSAARIIAGIETMHMCWRRHKIEHI